MIGLNLHDTNNNLAIVGDSTPFNMAMLKRFLKILEEDGGNDYFRAITIITDIRVSNDCK